MKTAYEMRISDWISDVCSSDLRLSGPYRVRFGERFGTGRADRYGRSADRGARSRQPASGPLRRRGCGGMRGDRRFAGDAAFLTQFGTRPTFRRAAAMIEFAARSRETQRSEEHTSELKALMP